MRKLYEKHEILFAVLWISVYCFATIPIRGNLGDESIWMLAALLAIAAGITGFVKANHLEEKYGLAAWPKDTGRSLFFLPMWLLATGNLWGGVSPSYRGAAQWIAVASMLLIGYVEEMLFRGFLFKALIPKDGIVAAVVISSVTFGIGHLVNLLAGQATFETVVQVFFAISWGFLFTMVFYKSGSLLPCIVAHGLVDAFSKFGADTESGDWLCVGTTIAVSIVYCLYLSRLKSAEQPRKKGGKRSMMETDRIRIYPASVEQMEGWIAAEKDEELKKAYREMLEGCLSHPEQWEWYAAWMIETIDKTHIGDLCFKGIGAGGNPEIGYGILEEFRGRGYAVEAVKLALAWAFRHPGIVAVEAETDPDNAASQKVLIKCGFRPSGEIGAEGPRFVCLKSEGTVPGLPIEP